MKITLNNQTMDLKFKVDKEYIAAWTEDENGVRTPKLTISPVEGHIEASGNIEIIADVPVRKIRKFAKLFNKVKQMSRERCHMKVAS